MTAKPHLSPSQENGDGPLPLDRAIELLESGEADENICIDFGGGYVGTADGPDDLPGLLQRARGLRLVMMMAEMKPVERPVHLRSGMSALHPLVKEILDALRQSG